MITATQYKILIAMGLTSNLIAIHLIRKVEKQLKLLHFQHEGVVNYLLHVLRDNHIEPTEFDVLALKMLGVELREMDAS